MGLAKVITRAVTGLRSPQVTVEVHVANGLPSFNIVGLPEASVREAKDRVRSAIQNSGYEFPASRITVNLAPADLPKQGAGFDLPVALGILAATAQLNPAPLDSLIIVAELALSGALRPVKGILPMALASHKEQRPLLLAADNAAEACLVDNLAVYPAGHLAEVVAAFNAGKVLPQAERQPLEQGPPSYPELADVKGQHQVKRALLVAAAGAHNLMMEGPPGSGKSMLAKRLPGLLPAMTNAEALELAVVQSLTDDATVGFGQRPFRTVHHTASRVALIGGAQPGEISRAHHGLLFADEATEFPRGHLEALRDPLENGYIDISRANFRYRYPARFQLVMAMNPCPCGNPEDCRDTPDQIRRYRSKLSGPILDRIDLRVLVPKVPHADLAQLQSEKGITTETGRQQVTAARMRQYQRQGRPNAWLEPKQIESLVSLSAAASQLLEQAMLKLNMSARSYHRLIKVALTIADLETADQIGAEHMAEAIGYRG